MKYKFLLIFISACFWLCANAQETEPNNTPAQANVLKLNGSNSGAINPAGDVDWYSLTTNADGLVNLHLTSTDGINLTVLLYDHNGTTLLSQSTTASTLTLSTDGLATGTYYVEVQAYYSSQTGKYTIADSLLTPVYKNDNEPNGSATQAVTLPLNGALQGHVGYYYNNTRDTSDWYKVTTNADGKLQLTLTSGNGNNVTCALYDGNGTKQLLSLTTASNTTNSFDGLAAGTYYLQVNSYYNNQFEPYQIQNSLILPAYKDDKEPNNTIEQALTIPLFGSAQGHVGYYYNNVRDTSDWYKFTTNADGAIKLTLTSGNGNYVTCLLYDGDGTTQLVNFSTASNNTATVDGLAAGTYYLQISSYYGDQFETYQIQDSLIVPAIKNDQEPNNSQATALTLPLNGNLQGHIGYYYDDKRDSSDWYKVTTTQDGLLKLFLTSGNGNYVTATLYDEKGGEQLVSFSAISGSNIATKDGLAAGTYYLQIQSYYNSQFEPYIIGDSLILPTIKDDKEPNNTKEQADTLSLNGSTTGHIGYYYNNVRDTSDWYKVTTNADGELKLTLTSFNNNYVNCWLYDADGVTQLQNFNSANVNSTVIDGLAAGTYYLLIQSYYNGEFEQYKLADSLFTYNPNDPESNGNPYQASLIPANATATGHVDFLYNNRRDTTDWWKINYNDSSGNLKINYNLLPNLSNNNIPYTYLQVYKDTLAAPIYNNAFNADSNTINLSSLTQGIYYFKVAMYYQGQFIAYSITPHFKQSYYLATIKLLQAVQSDSCSNNSLSYLLGGSQSPYTPYTVVLFHNGVAYDTTVVNKDTVNFTYLPAGSYYAIVHGFNAPANVYSTSTTTTFSAPKITPLPKDIPVITTTGRLLHASPHAAREFFQWYRGSTLLITGAYDSTYLATDTGTYTARFSNACGIGAASNGIYFSTVYKTQAITFPALRDTVFSNNLIIILHAVASSALRVTYSVVIGPASIHSDSLYITGVGAVTVEADQGGNSSYAPAPPIQQSFTVSQAKQKITFAAPSQKYFGDTAFALHAFSSSGLPISYVVVSGPANINNDSFVNITGVGAVTIQASQGGNGNYLPAANTNITFCVGVKTVGAISGYSVACPAAFKYAVAPISGATYVWGISGGGVLTSHGDSASVIWQKPGNYIIYVRGYSDCDSVRSDSSALHITVTGVINPGPVTNMLPANGAANQQLPLTLSWIPGPQTTTYDLYIWNADSTKPTKPYAANFTAVNFTLPAGSLAYNKTYNWSVTSRNACASTAGPFQKFSLIPLPDLTVTTVQTPTSAFSGQPISVTWKVKNIGPGRTNINQSWTDGVFLSMDSTADFSIPPNTNPAAWNQLQFPVRPLLIAAVPNTSALDSGQSYTNTVNFTLPVNYSWPLYAYVITNYAPGSNAPLEVKTSNDTAFSHTPIKVTLSPTPDLRVDSVFTPASAFSGSAVNVTFKVRNYGTTTPSGTGWYDALYISKSPFFDVTTATLLNTPKSNGTFYFNPPLAEFGNPGQLQNDSFYYRSATVIIPNFIYGNYFIYAYTDAGNSVYEGTLENNNAAASLMQIYITPTPDLTVSSVTLPSVTLSTTQPVGINWNINNTGYFDNLQKNQGHYLDTILHCSVCYVPYCPPPVNVCTGCVYICPAPEPGYRVRDSVSWGTSHWLDYVYLSTDSTKLDITKAKLLGTFLHGAKDPINNYDDATSVPLPQYGSGIPNGANPRSYDVNTSNVVRPGGAYPGNLSFSIADTLSQGNYYIYVWGDADSEVYEYPSQKSIKRSSAISIVRPDITVTSVTIPTSGAAGQSINLNYTLLDIGKGGVFNHTRQDYIYFSKSSVFDATAQLLTSQYYQENLLVDVPVSHQVAVTLPIGSSGNYYFYVFANADSSFRETNMNNNINGTNTNTNVKVITITPVAIPNISVSSVTVPDTVFSVLGFPLKYAVPNAGPGATSGYWTDSIYISCSSTYSTSTAIGIAARVHGNVIAANSSYTDSLMLFIPYTFNLGSCFGNGNARAYFYVKANANGGLYEGSIVPKAVGTSAITVINPLVDQIVTNITAADSTIIGRNYAATWSVKNLGYNPGGQYYNSWTDALYFSPDSVFNSNAIRAGSSNQNTPLNTGQSYSATANFTTPNLPAGDYYVFINTNADNSIPGEQNLANNISVMRNSFGIPTQVNVTVPLLPDLTDSILTAPSKVATGQPLTVKYSVSNGGPGATYPNNWSDDFWLSSDYIPGNGGDIYLGSINHTGALQPHQSYIDSLTATIAMNVPAGNYILIARTNSSGNIFETNANNNLSFRYVTIYTPAPSDLTVINVTHSDTAILGDTSSVKWAISNIAPNAAVGIETDGVYLSRDSVFDSTAVLVGTRINYLNLLPLANQTFTLNPVISNITEGNYFVIVKTDLLDNIVESNKDNNTGIAVKPMYIKVKQLPINVKTPDSVGGNSILYYKVIIPASLKGATMLVTLKSNDSLSVNNQMYVGLGYIPSSSQFDYEYGAPNAGNQQILMPSVTDSVYYITVQCVSANPPKQHVTLLAVNLPFSILSVTSNQGGNTGNVTVQITGSLFADSMKATLYNETTKNTITASAVYYVNSTSVYATFNLAGAALGVYDLILTKTNGSKAALVKGFSVVAPNNGGLITGGGTNTGQSGSGNEPGCDPGDPSGLNSQLQTQLVLPANVFAGWPFQIQINFSNPTNVDIPAQTRVLYSQNGLPVSLTQAGLSAGATSLYIQFTEQNGPPNIIRAGSTGTIIIYSQAPANYPGHTKVYFNLK